MNVCDLRLRCVFTRITSQLKLHLDQIRFMIDVHFDATSVQYLVSLTNQSRMMDEIFFSSHLNNNIQYSQ
ncbi:hypothetical protein RCL_jg26286.t1 [Rhizophagus clarus]|uniref:Uncharacterized protein n=1 Tax=Rhizophagus clarus TaxID=94130 RepID=A0A8H3KYS9_9GLOM|nr:hypothetical protein RCL_jg26286.t1 [Rhizophagus clarus]